ncbi:carbohydrate sulfotransferase 10-like [Anneissia japonica]|uniref:carbohydrate sulfotransferase 10-like n=1 Tax=Anneissia japonica TaxID=1529436 RepID=UPI0014254D55|nr:carbohydrate sulfotransferase 10-like [Anneissia japonica]XP_033116130.1 carbohydrate sulfotransferase 10-like [Anneissia japonica]XP_033116132.1 carbohydrate sulfotransferase 10-like [Anneissia japonica]XP_033116133.1 carbohydrate sulfotransferase 10-like [Anneissia japonica]
MKRDFIGILLTAGILVIFFWNSVPQSTITTLKSVVPKAKAGRLDQQKNDFLRRMRNIQNERKQTLKKACKKYKSKIGKVDVYKHPPWNIAINDEYKLLYCFTPKVASTSWKRLLLVLNGFMNSTDDLPQHVVNRAGMNSFQYLEERSPKDVKYILSSYTKFMFTRNPFSRVLSAFRNKLAPDTNFSQTDIWRDKLGYYLSTLYTNETKGDTQTSYNLTFMDFVHFLTDPDQTDHKHWKNPHWGYQYQRCRPCEIEYDVIGKFESLQEDARYIMRIAHIGNVTSFPSSSGSNPTDSSNTRSLHSYYSTLPVSYIQSLYQRYIIDFEMFGYKKPTSNIPFK